MAFNVIKYFSPNTVVGVWKLIEPESFFRDYVDQICLDPEQVDSIAHDHRRKEWLAGRFMIAQLAQLLDIEFDNIYTDDYGKPHLNGSDAQVSISHADSYVVAMINRDGPCGIDVEGLRPKLQKLAPKFLSSPELLMAQNDVRKLAIMWGAKEALYKLHGRKQLIFKENLAIESIDFDGGKGDFKAKIIENGQVVHVSMRFFNADDHVLVITL